MLAHDLTALAYGLAREGHDLKSKTVHSIALAIKEHSSPMFEEKRLYEALRRAHDALGSPLCNYCGESLSAERIAEYEKEGFKAGKHGMTCAPCIANLPF